MRDQMDLGRLVSSLGNTLATAATFVAFAMLLCEASRCEAGATVSQATILRATAAAVFAACTYLGCIASDLYRLAYRDRPTRD